MGYIFAMSRCFGCDAVFQYNPDLVPSIPVNGERQPVCGRCVERVNPMRIENGLPPIVPLPGAYEPQETP